MTDTSKARRRHGARPRWQLPVALLPTLLLAGCDWAATWENIVDALHLRVFVTFFTAGSVATYERNLMTITLIIMMFVLVPVVTLTLWFAWRYRVGNERSKWRPGWGHSGILEIFLWGGPIVIILILGTMTWYSTFELDPYKSTNPDQESLVVKAISMDWKWLFIYPKYDVAVVDELAMPVNTPVRIELTSATAMTSFMIPRLAGQIMAMAGMRTKLHLDATEPGVFFGRNYQYTGDGFHDMTFDAKAMDRDSFAAWVAKARRGKALDDAAFRRLVKPSQPDSVQYFSSVKPNLFEQVIGEFNDGDSNPFDPQRTAGH